MKWLLFLPLLLCSGWGAYAKEDPRDAFASGYQLYSSESDDFVQTLKQSEREFRTIRQLVLRDQYEEKFSRLENQLLESNNKLIDEIEGYIKKNGTNTVDDLLLMRLSHLHYKKEQFIWSRKQKVYNDKLQDYLDGKIKKAPAAPRPNQSPAIFYAKELLKYYPNSNLGDQAHYIIAVSLEDMGENGKAAEIYKRFLKYHANSPLADEIMWRLAEHYYEKRDLQKAAFLYNRISEIPESSFRMKAIYKLAAAYFDARNYGVAADYFVRIYQETKDKTFGSAENLTFYEDSLEYLGILYTKGIKLKIGEEATADAVLALVGVLHREARENEARRLISKYISENPFSGRLPKFSQAVIESYLSEGDAKRADVIRQRSLSTLIKDKTWWNKNRKDKSSLFEAQDFLEEQLLAGAKYQVDQGYETEQDAYFKKAESNYLSFLREFPFSPLATQARFELAQVEYQLKDFPTASRNFRMVADADDGRAFRREAAYGYLWSEAKKVNFPINNTEGVNLSKSPTTITKKIGMSRPEKVFLNAARYYVEKYPLGERTQKVLYKVAELYYKKNHLDLAEIAIRRIVADKQNSSLTTLKALLLSAEISNLQNNWGEVASRVHQIRGLSLSHRMDSAGGIDVNTSSDSRWLAAVEDEELGRDFEAGLKYENLGLLNSGSDVSDEAFWRASVLFSRSGHIMQSNENIKRLRGEEYRQKGEYLSAVNLQRMLRFKTAAAAFSKFGQKYNKTALGQEAFLAAASLYRDLKSEKQATEHFALYSKSSSSRLLWYIALEGYANAGDVEQVKENGKYVVQYGDEAYYRVQLLISRALWNSGKTEESAKNCGTLERKLDRVGKESYTAQIQRASFECSYYKTGPTDAFFVNEVEFLKFGHNDLIAQAHIERGRTERQAGNAKVAMEHFSKAWDLSDRNLFSVAGEQAYKELISSGQSLGFQKISLIDWTVARGLAIQWREPKESNDLSGIVSTCESGLDEICIKRLSDPKTEMPAEVRSRNLVRAYIMSGRDQLAENELKKLGKITNWSADTVALAYLLKSDEVIPYSKRGIALVGSGDDREYFLAATGYRHLNSGELREALDSFQKAVDGNPRYPAAYLGMAELLMKNESFLLANKVLEEGVRNTQNTTGLLAASIMFNSFNEDILYPNNGFGEDIRVTFAKGFSDLVQNRPKRAQESIRNIPKDSFWRTQIEGVDQVLAGRAADSNEAQRWSRQYHYLSQIKFKDGNSVAEVVVKSGNFNPILDLAGVRENSDRIPANKSRGGK
ncbi:MAG: tetratricopeptide repeat protein [Bdellovibrionales bacterium]|nr:tetratricopeptide repeat protein [Bdellovibrionales bacterium]